MAINDNLPAGVSPEFRQAFEEVRAEYLKDLNVKLALIKSSIDRVLSFLKIAIKAPESANDILRAMIVLNHAYLEDFLRTLGTVFLPNADAAVLDNIPLAGSANKSRTEKFSLGKLAQYRGKMVDDVIRSSVLEDLDRRSFNSVTEIISFLDTIGISPTNGDWNSDLEKARESVQEDMCGGLAALDTMIQRRHNIVHRADKTKNGDELETVSFLDFDVWRRTTYTFMMVVAYASHQKAYNLEAFIKKMAEKEPKLNINVERVIAHLREHP